MNARSLYLVLTVIGFAVPILLIIPWVQAYGFDLGLLMQQAVATEGATIAMFDLSWAALTAVVFMLVQVRRHHVPAVWLAMVGTFTIGLCFGLPLFLYLRERGKLL